LIVVIVDEMFNVQALGLKQRSISCLSYKPWLYVMDDLYWQCDATWAA